MMQDRIENARLSGSRAGYQEGKQQDFAARGLMCLGAACAGDAVSAVYADAHLKAFQEALDDLRAAGVTVDDPRDAK